MSLSTRIRRLAKRFRKELNWGQPPWELHVSMAAVDIAYAVLAELELEEKRKKKVPQLLGLRRKRKAKVDTDATDS